MKKKLILLATVGLALGGAILANNDAPMPSGRITANAGTTFKLFLPTTPDGIFAHTVDGVAQVSLLGKCLVHADLEAVPTATGTFIISGDFELKSIDGSGNRLKGTWEGEVNPASGDIDYAVTFTGGSGDFANARGAAVLDGFALINNPSGPPPFEGTATWTMTGQVFTHGHVAATSGF